MRRVPIEDHNVPQLAAMISWCRELEAAAARDAHSVFAVHCRGGKGRTGLMVCAWLLWSGSCKTADEALELWAKRPSATHAMTI